MSAWKDSTTIIEVVNGEVSLVQGDPNTLQFKKPFPETAGTYQWRPVRRLWYGTNEVGFWTPRCGWSKKVLEKEPDTESLPEGFGDAH